LAPERDDTFCSTHGSRLPAQFLRINRLFSLHQFCAA